MTKEGDLSGWSNAELREMVVSKGENKTKVKFWSRKKLIKYLEANKPKGHEGQIREKAENLAEEVSPGQKDPPKRSDDRQRMMRRQYLVKWYGSNSSLRHSPLQGAPQIEFHRDGPWVDLEEAFRGMLGTRHPQRDMLAKDFARRAAKIYKAQAEAGVPWMYKEKLGPVPVKQVDGTKGTFQVYQDILAKPTDEVMKWVRLLREEKVKPIEASPDPERQPKAGIQLTIERLYYLEMDNPDYRPMLTDWLYDESREVQGFDRVRTNIRSDPTGGM